jgi:hypothetical protein
VLGLAVVEGVSMSPTLQAGDRLLVRYGARPRAGALAVVRLPQRPLSVKRLGHHTDEGWWVERDNPERGTDSWTAGVGALPETDVVAVVLARVWPRPTTRLRRR